MTWITVFVYYLFGCPNRESDSEDAALSIDRSLLKWIWKKVFRRSRVPKLPPAVVNTLEEGILAFSDLQLVTSLSLLIAGFSQLRCSINTYDWQLLTYTAWFASVTHLTTLTAIRTFFRHHHNTISVIRMGLMLVVLTLLCAALLPTFHPLWLTNQFLSVAVPAVCYFEELGTTKRLSMTDTIGSSSIVSVSVSICILVVSYTARVVQIYRPLHVWTKRVLRQCPGNFLKRLILQMHSKWLEPIRFLLAAQLVLGRAIYDLVSSLFWEVSAPPTENCCETLTGTRFNGYAIHFYGAVSISGASGIMVQLRSKDIGAFRKSCHSCFSLFQSFHCPKKPWVSPVMIVNHSLPMVKDLSRTSLITTNG